MHRASTALALGLLILTPAAAQAHDGAPRVALAPIDDTIGLDPRALVDMGMGLRGVALEEDIDVVDLAADDRAAQGCDLDCLGELADQLGADYLITGTSGRSTDGLEVALELRRLERGAVGDTVATASASGQDTAALVADTERAGRELLGEVRALAPPPVRTAVRRPARVQERPGYAYRAGAPYSERSAGLALALEILFPGAGLGYAGDWGSVGLQYLGIFTGFVLVISSIETAHGEGNVDGAGMTMGLVLLLGSRLYGIIRAPAAAEDYNREARREWEASRGADLRQLRLRAPEIGLSSPRYTSFALPPLTF